MSWLVRLDQADGDVRLDQADGDVRLHQDDGGELPIRAPLTEVVNELRQAWARDLNDLPKDGPSGGSWEEFVNELRAEMALVAVEPPHAPNEPEVVHKVTIQDYQLDRDRLAQARPASGFEDLGNLLDELKLAHLKGALAEFTLLECIVGIEDRPVRYRHRTQWVARAIHFTAFDWLRLPVCSQALLRRLQESGVSKLPERQKIANALSRHRREGGWLEPPKVPEAEAAALQPTQLVAPTLEHYFEAGGLLFAPCGKCHHLGEDRLQGVSRHLSLSGPILQAVARLAKLSGRPVLVAKGALDPFALGAQSSDCAAQTILDEPKLAACREALGADLLVLAAAVPFGGPSTPCVLPLPPFDAWAEGESHALIAAVSWLLSLPCPFQRPPATPLAPPLPDSNPCNCRQGRAPRGHQTLQTQEATGGVAWLFRRPRELVHNL